MSNQDGEVYSSDELGRVKKLGVGAITSQLNFLEGKVLTIIDASFSDERQCKAVKDLIRSAFYDQYTFIADFCYVDLPVKTRGQLESQGVDLEHIEAQ